MRQFGLIGYPLTHSFSQKYFTKKFDEENLDDCTYELFPLENIDDIRLLFEIKKNLNGLNVTIPYKETVIQYLDYLNETAEQIGAVNCIKITELEKTGFNTDWLAFRDSILPLLKSHHKKALILGTGGASKAVIYALKEFGIQCKQVSRNATGDALGYADLNKNVFDEFSVIVNTTPAGMYPNINTFPDIPYQYFSQHHIAFDLVYNPEKTVFMKKAEQQNAIIKNGLEMLMLQAEYAWKIWNI